MKITLTRRGKGIGILVAALVVALAIPQPTYALFGFGDIVFDPTSYATLGNIWSQDVSNATKLVETITQLQKIYGNALQMYTLSQQMAVRVQNKNTWITAATGAANNFTQNRYGETVNWSAVMNGDPVHAAAAYTNATTRLSPNIDLSNETLGSSYHLANLASVESMDGTHQACLQVVAQYRANQQSNQSAFASLNASTTDGTDSTNSMVAQLNVLAGANAQLRAEQVSQGTLQSCLVQEQILANMIQRNNQVEALNMYAQIQQKNASNPMMLSSMSNSLNADIQ